MIPLILRVNTPSSTSLTTLDEADSCAPLIECTQMVSELYLTVATGPFRHSLAGSYLLAPGSLRWMRIYVESQWHNTIREASCLGDKRGKILVCWAALAPEP
jgi:hypothetical protein